MNATTIDWTGVNKRLADLGAYIGSMQAPYGTPDKIPTELLRLAAAYVFLTTEIRALQVQTATT